MKESTVTGAYQPLLDKDVERIAIPKTLSMNPDLWTHISELNVLPNAHLEKVYGF
jgi:hypothetical protein